MTDTLIARNQLLLKVAFYQSSDQPDDSQNPPSTAPESPEKATANNLNKSARIESFRRVPETCPALHAGGVWVVTDFIEWLDNRFADHLSEASRTEIAGRLAGSVCDLLDIAKGAGTLPLRAALVREIESQLCPPKPSS